MLINVDTKICGRKTVLVPYRKSHVEKYHQWMQSEELLEETCSQRLSLTDEMKMQQSWLHSEDKCTFIILDRGLMDTTDNEIASMVGDVNLFLTKNDDESLVGEISLMVAEKALRSGGRGKEAALHMLRYGAEVIKVKEFIAVINENNIISVNLFSKLQFINEGSDTVFKQVRMKREVDKEWLSWLIDITPFYEIGVTEPNC